jgi:hypothetical protein
MARPTVLVDDPFPPSLPFLAFSFMCVFNCSALDTGMCGFESAGEIDPWVDVSRTRCIVAGVAGDLDIEECAIYEQARARDEKTRERDER